MFSLLLVDDEEYALAALRHALPWEEFGFTEIHTAASSSQAWDILTTAQIDACFIDIRMPGMSGLELLHSARQQGLETLFVVVSGYSDFAYAKQAIQLGVLDYCLKPVCEEECRPVLEKLAQHIPAKRIAQDLPYVARLLSEADFCQDFLSKLSAGDTECKDLTLLLLRTPNPGQILKALDALLPARALFLGEEEALLIWGNPPAEDTFVSFLESWQHSALLAYGTAPPDAAAFQNTFRRLRIISHSPDTVPTGIIRLPSINEETASYLTGILAYMESHYEERLTLQNLASQFGINYSYLSQLFKKATNLTFSEHLTNIRLTQACRLLSDTYMPIVDVAQAVGFPDYHYFCNTFKKRHSMTPSQYRESSERRTDS